jgi:hypothetical protein
MDALHFLVPLPEKTPLANVYTCMSRSVTSHFRSPNETVADQDFYSNPGEGITEVGG